MHTAVNYHEPIGHHSSVACSYGKGLIQWIQTLEKTLHQNIVSSKVLDKPAFQLENFKVIRYI